jgi:hypothetical protein
MMGSKNMKKILYFLALIFCASCSTTYMVGNIHVYDENHNEVETYNNIVIDDSIFKSHGLNFYDAESENFVYLGKSTIYSITYIPITVDAPTVELPETDKDYLSNADRYILYRSQLVEQLNGYKEQIKLIDKNSPVYTTIQNNIKDLRNTIRDIEEILWKNYNLSMDDYW